MGGYPRATEDQKATFWHLVKTGIPHVRAASEVGMSRQWAWRQMRGLNRNGNGDNLAMRRQILQAQLPPPKAWDDLDELVQECLRDFNLFSEVFLCRHPSPWRLDAANRTVEWLHDRETRTYADINTPPGVGKTTLWTHDIPCWLVAGGGFLDPSFGRALRFMLGSFTKNVSTHYVRRVRMTLERVRPFFDKQSRKTAELAMPVAFGRFKPLAAEGDETLWTTEQFLVAQLADIDVVEKEPTFQAASYESGFLGERVDYSAWDDLSTTKTAGSPGLADKINGFYEDEAETRVEPGGVGLLIGQRLSAIDLHRKRLDATYLDDDGIERPLYEHIVYVDHIEDNCDGDHRQADAAATRGEDGDGCLLDAVRLPWRDIQKAQGKANYATVYQQRDVDPFDVLVQEAWLDGGEDYQGFLAPGCNNNDRGFLEWPKNVGPLINYACVDPAAGNWWAIEWWAVQAEPPHRRYLIWGARQRMQAGELLDWKEAERKHGGTMEDLTILSCAHGQPILVWVIEHNSAFKHLFQYEHFKTWQRKWAKVRVRPHTSGINKIDLDKGVEALLPTVYRGGLKDLPTKPSDMSARNYMRQKRSELTTYPKAPTWDTVVCDWFGEANMPHILAAGRKFRDTKEPPMQELPPYLQAQRREVAVAAAG